MVRLAVRRRCSKRCATTRRQCLAIITTGRNEEGRGGRERDNYFYGVAFRVNLVCWRMLNSIQYIPSPSDYFSFSPSCFLHSLSLLGESQFQSPLHTSSLLGQKLFALHEAACTGLEKNSNALPSRLEFGLDGKENFRRAYEDL